MAEIQNRIRDLIATHGSVRAVERVCGVTDTYILALLSGDYTNPSATVLVKLGLPPELARTGPSAATWTPDPPGVEWRAVPAYDGFYEISNMGEVRSLPRLCQFGNHQREVGGKVLKPNVRKADGYLRIFLFRGQVRQEHQLHRLVLTAFVGACPPGMEACHNNGQPSDCRLSNLRWDTPSANCADKHAHGTMVKGDACHTAKLTAAKVQAVRADGRRHADIAAQYGITRRHVSQIQRRKSWSWLP